MSSLFLVRHGKSEWNHLGLWTGWTDVSLVEEGLEEARRAGELLKEYPIEHIFVSGLKRAQQTLEEIKGKIAAADVPTIIAPELNERHYGIYTGKNKWQIKEELGEEEFLKLRRHWDYPVPEGESLKEVSSRVVPFYEMQIEPLIREGRNLLVVAHGNSLRALMKHLEEISDEAVADLEIKTGEIHSYFFDENSKMKEKKVL